MAFQNHNHPQVKQFLKKLGASEADPRYTSMWVASAIGYQLAGGNKEIARAEKETVHNNMNNSSMMRGGREPTRTRTRIRRRRK